MEPVSFLAVQPLHVDLWQTGCTAGHTGGKVIQHSSCACMLLKKAEDKQNLRSLTCMMGALNVLYVDSSLHPAVC